MARLRQRDGQVQRGRRLRDPALLVGEGEDLHGSLRGRVRPASGAKGWRRFMVGPIRSSAERRPSSSLSSEVASAGPLTARRSSSLSSFPVAGRSVEVCLAIGGSATGSGAGSSATAFSSSSRNSSPKGSAAGASGGESGVASIGGSAVCLPRIGNHPVLGRGLGFGVLPLAGGLALLAAPFRIFPVEQAHADRLFGYRGRFPPSSPEPGAIACENGAIADLLDKRLAFVTGKGGVGKTTVAYALGLAAAARGSG